MNKRILPVGRVAVALLTTLLVGGCSTDVLYGELSEESSAQSRASQTAVAASATVNVTLTDYVSTGGTISIDAGGIGSTRNGAYVVYRVSVTESGLYDAFALFGSKYDGSSLAMDMDVDASVLASRPTEPQLTQAVANTGSWTPSKRYTTGPFRLQAGHDYYLRLTFLQKESGRWAGNVSKLGLQWSGDQENKSAVPVDVTTDEGYRLYALDGNDRQTVYPFWRGWAWEPNYIEVKDNAFEFYYNQAALDADNRRERRGCELTCPFKATSEGWYGFRIFLSEEGFAKTLSGSIFCQLFNNGDRNSWAGHLSLDKQQVVLSYRHALVDPTTRTVGTVEWGKWTKVVLYFRVGRNQKGSIRVWLGEEVDEATPSLKADNINFGFGEWTDDTHLDGEVSEANEKADYIGCKFGLYVSSGGDRTIRFDDIRALEGNPEGAFGIVCPPTGGLDTGIHDVRI
ncbi:MAG: heparin lyase I family protein [Bacteroidaceae bacterium]|nr:heparin lyase I family protein [Bacteroidaceae bacterium]